MHNSELSFSQIANILFDEDASYGDILLATRAYKELLYLATEFNEDLSEAGSDSFTTSGKVIAAKWAGKCVDDYLRTKRFCLGLLKAVQFKKTQSKAKVHILYAGTGPFAALALPLITKFSPEEIAFSFLELNNYSFQILEKTIIHFNIQEYIHAVEQCDATNYVVPNPDEIDILLTETMTHGLKSEHQVAISYRILSQLSEEAILIPKEIQLNLLAVNEDIRDANQKSFDTPRPYFDRLGNLFTLNADEIRKHQKFFNAEFPNITFSEREIMIPTNVNSKFHHISVETQIEIFDDQRLETDESGLTSLLKLTDLNQMLSHISTIVGVYVCGDMPGLQCRLKN
jgi:hypothetical protein